MISKKIINNFLALDTACVSDALDSLGLSGGLKNIHSLIPGKKIAGPAFTVKYRKIQEREKKNLKNAGNYIDLVPPNSIIVIDNNGRSDCTSWGNILTVFAMRKKIAGTVVYGSIRDVEKIKKLKYPVFSSYVFMQSGKNRAIKIYHQKEININGVKIKPNDLIFCDDNGCVVVPKEIILLVLKRAKIIKINEEKILKDIKKGLSLKEAREKNNYKTPWIK